MEDGVVSHPVVDIASLPNHKGYGCHKHGPGLQEIPGHTGLKEFTAATIAGTHHIMN